jgi:hypothetical protein
MVHIPISYKIRSTGCRHMGEAPGKGKSPPQHECGRFAVYANCRIGGGCVGRMKLWNRMCDFSDPIFFGVADALHGLLPESGARPAGMARRSGCSRPGMRGSTCKGMGARHGPLPRRGILTRGRFPVLMCAESVRKVHSMGLIIGYLSMIPRRGRPIDKASRRSDQPRSAVLPLHGCS